jgi:hypothetical protein
MPKTSAPDIFMPHNDHPIIKIADIAYLRFGRVDLARARAYFLDFGLHVAAETEGAIYFRGILPQHHCVIVERSRRDDFLGFGLRAQSLGDLETLAHHHQSDVVASIEPGGGMVVKLRDPAGVRVEVVFGLSELTALPHRAPRAFNFPGDKRRINQPQPCLPRPAEVFRLGHLVQQRQEFARNANWYIENFGLIASDVETLPDTREPILAFLRCDRGSEPVDHHTLVLASGPNDSYDHAAFEALDLDAIALGGEWLQRQGWVQNWGIGRHVLGSQVFNYHFDPSGFSVEHYADGDDFDATYPTRYHESGKEGLYQWGPDLPAHFIEVKPSLGLLAAIWKGLKTRPGFSLDRLMRVKKTFDRPARPWAGKPPPKPKPTN